MVDQLRSFAAEVTRVAREVGTEGKLGGQAQVPGVAGTWKDLTDNVNSMASNLTDQVRNIAEVATAVARGDLSRKITVDVKGEILELIFFSSRRRHTRWNCDWSSDVCSSDLRWRRSSAHAATISATRSRGATPRASAAVRRSP